MPYKLKVGDRVTVKKRRDPTASAFPSLEGHTGQVTEHDPDARWPYEVTGRGWSGVFTARELEAAPAKARKKRKAK